MDGDFGEMEMMMMVTMMDDERVSFIRECPILSRLIRHKIFFFSIKTGKKPTQWWRPR
jgi:hypothetical protein